jgi:predicted metallopeptidase
MLRRVPRLNVTLAVKRLVRDVAARVPELAHVRAARVLVVAGEARRASRATIRPAGGKARSRAASRPVIRVKGRTILYVITLRPLWFRGPTPEERIATILHELYHASRRFDGTLHRGRRHASLPKAAYDRKIRALLGRYLAVAPAEVMAPFAASGTVRARMWLERPAAARANGAPARRLYTERQLFYGPVRMITPRAPHRTPSARAGSRRARPS